MRNRILYLIFIVLLLISCEKEIKFIVKEEFKQEFVEKGKDVTAAAFNELSKNLKNAITNSGFEGAVSFCKVEAPKITMEVSKESRALVKRVSDKPRNKSNAASEKEIDIINNYKKLINSNEKIEPVLDAEKSIVTFYSPIKMMPLCLNCHGDSKNQIGQSILDIISELYPEDKAVNYKIDELRGLWKVVFPMQQAKVEVLK